MPAADPSKNAKATTSFILGVVGILAWALPILGAPITIIGLILGIKGLASQKRKLAIAAIVLNIAGLFLTVVNGSIGAYMGMTGQNPIVNQIFGTSATSTHN